MADLLLGQVLSFTGDPFADGPEAARLDSAVLIDGGRSPILATPTPCAPATRRPASPTMAAP